MEWILLLALSAIIAILYSKINIFVQGTTWGAKIYGNGSFLRATAVATGVIFLSIVIASVVLGLVADKPRLPA